MCPVTFRFLVLRMLLLLSKQPKAVALISSFIEKQKSKYFLDTLSCPCEYGFLSHCGFFCSENERKELLRTPTISTTQPQVLAMISTFIEKQKSKN